MGVADISLSDVKTLTGVLERLPQGSAARDLAERLGLWSTTSHSTAARRATAFPTAFARLDDGQLSDQNAYWLSEAFRATELAGLLEGQRLMLNVQSKALRAGTRGTLRRKYRQESANAAAAGTAVPKDPSATQLADEVEEDPLVREADALLGMLTVVLESAKAYKEACFLGTAGLSREISFRQAQMGARIR